MFFLLGKKENQKPNPPAGGQLQFFIAQKPTQRRLKKCSSLSFAKSNRTHAMA